jgi:hypothetical protein
MRACVVHVMAIVMLSLADQAMLPDLLSSQPNGRRIDSRARTREVTARAETQRRTATSSTAQRPSRQEIQTYPNACNISDIDERRVRALPELALRRLYWEWAHGRRIRRSGVVFPVCFRLNTIDLDYDFANVVAFNEGVLSDDTVRYRLESYTQPGETRLIGDQRSTTVRGNHRRARREDWPLTPAGCEKSPDWMRRVFYRRTQERPRPPTIPC